MDIFSWLTFFLPAFLFILLNLLFVSIRPLKRNRSGPIRYTQREKEKSAENVLFEIIKIEFYVLFRPNTAVDIISN